jgi:hypothetical protein
MSALVLSGLNIGSANTFTRLNPPSPALATLTMVELEHGSAFVVA